MKLNRAVISLVLLYKQETDHHQSFDEFKKTHLDIKPILAQIDTKHVGVKEYPVIKNKNYARKDWHGWEFIEYEKKRKGNGEQGKPLILTDPKEIQRDSELREAEGFSAFTSDFISVNRSLPDTRPPQCQHKKYLKELPTTSVIVIFHNEWFSVLMRTIHSIYNRTPRELLKEVILVNDNSTRPGLNEQIEKYLPRNFDDRVKLLHLKERKGLIVTRMEGARIATGEVLVFLDSHMEVNLNWLPPLLEVIAISPKTLATPTIDDVSGKTFEYGYRPGTRGVFDEIMWYQWFKLRPQDTEIPDREYQVPILLGCAIAIRRDFFYDIGQNDEGLMIWNGEQIELSLKVHLCGGNLVEVPCSRASHFFRGHKHHGIDGVDVAARNFKRIGEVWMDEFKEVMYRTDPKRFLTVDIGDITKAVMVKEKLNCKPFRYFLENIAPEMYYRYYYQADYPGFFAWGAIQSNAFPNKCIDFMNDYSKPVQLYDCNDKDLKDPNWTQHFKLTWARKLRTWFKDDGIRNDLRMEFSEYDESHNYQNWKYDLKTKQLINIFEKKCITALSDAVELSMTPCNTSLDTQKFTWGNVNETALERFDEIFYANNTFFGFD